MQQNKNQKARTDSNRMLSDQQNPEIEPEKRSGEDEKVIAAHDQAEEDIEDDPELSAHSPNDDLDEAESARLGEDETGLV